MDNTREKLIELITGFYGVDPMYYGVETQPLVDHLIANGVTMQSGIDAKTFQLMRECERLKEENLKLSDAVNVLYELYSQRGMNDG